MLILGTLTFVMGMEEIIGVERQRQSTKWALHLIRPPKSKSTELFPSVFSIYYNLKSSLPVEPPNCWQPWIDCCASVLIRRDSPVHFGDTSRSGCSALWSTPSVNISPDNDRDANRFTDIDNYTLIHTHTYQLLTLKPLPSVHSHISCNDSVQRRSTISG